MKSFQNLVKITGLVAGSLLISTVAIAAECSGPWQVLQSQQSSQIAACAAMGLDTNRAVCQPGQRFATFCDDASGGRYRVCPSTIVCIENRGHRNRRDDPRNDQNERMDYPNEPHNYDDAPPRPGFGEMSR